jgi:hypothetical protein
MRAHTEFIKSIESLARRGWWRLKSEHGGNEELFFYVFFHVHPDDAQKVARNIQNAITEESIKEEWCLTEGKPGRFVFKPKGLGDLNNLEFNEEVLSIAENAYHDLIKIAEAIRFE